MLRGLATVSFFADDLPAAQRWYTDLLGVEPYFIRPLPPEELGIIDRTYAPGPSPDRPGGAVVFWHVDDLPATLDRLQAMGATEYEPLTDREAGFQTASVVDPFGNILGVMYNPHFLQMLNSPEA